MNEVFELRGNGGARDLYWKNPPDHEDPGFTGATRMVYPLVIEASIGSTPYTKEVEITVRNLEEEGSVRFISSSSFRVGSVLTGKVTDPDGVETDSDGVEVIKWSWHRSTEQGAMYPNFNPIPLGTSNTYRITREDVGWALKVSASYRDLQDATLHEVDFVSSYVPGIEYMAPVEYPEHGSGSVLTLRAWNTSGSPMSSATWSLGTGNDEGAFTISADGVLEFRMSPDYEQPVSNVDPSSDLASRNVYTVQVLVNDDGVSYSERFTITVTDVDEDGTVTLSTTTPVVGHPLGSGLVEPDGGVTNLQWQWQRRLSGTKNKWKNVSSSGARSEEFHQGQGYTPKPGDKGYVLQATVTYNDVHAEGQSAESEATSAVVDPPDPVRNLESSGANGRVEVSWLAPLSDGGSALTGYEYRQSAYQLNGRERTWSDWTAVPSPPPESDSADRAVRAPEEEEELPTSLTLSVRSCTSNYFEVRARSEAAAGDSVRVIALAPKWSGTLSSDTTWSGAVCVDGDVTIPSGVTLSLGSETEVLFSSGALIVSGTLEAAGVTFRSGNAVSPSTSDWSVIRVESGGTADLSGATIQDGGGCLQVHTSGTVTTTNTTLSNCDEEVSVSSGRPQVGVALTASLEGVSAGSWQWQGRNEGDSAPSWADLSGSSTSASYTPLRADLGRKLRAMVRYVPDSGSYTQYVQSEPTRAVMLAPPTGFEVWPDHEAVLLIWDDSGDNSITHWQYGKKERRTQLVWTEVADGEVASAEYEDRMIRYIRVEDLSNGVEYQFRVRAKADPAFGVATNRVWLRPATPQVAYGSSSYEAPEGGEPVSVSVSLSSKATQAVQLPIAVTADADTEAGDYTVSGLTAEAGIRRLPFALGDMARSFTLTARADSDGDDETVSLGFGDLPEGVSAGTQASAQVTLLDVSSVILVPPPNRPPNPPAGSTSVVFAEESSDTVATYRLSDPDPGAVLTLKIGGPSASSDSASFRISGDTLYFKEMEDFPDFEARTDIGGTAGDNDYVVRLYTWDGSLSSDTVAVTVSVTNVDEPGMVSVSLPRQVGTQLKATLTDPDGSVADTLWKWRRSPDATVWTPIEDLTLSRYVPGDTDAGQYLQATVIYTDGHGSDKPAASAALGPIASRTNRPPNPPAGSTSVVFAEESSDTVATYRLSDPDPGAVLTLKIG